MYGVYNIVVDTFHDSPDIEYKIKIHDGVDKKKDNYIVLHCGLLRVAKQ